MLMMTRMRLIVMAGLLAAPLMVSAQQSCKESIEASAPDSRYTTHGDGTVTDEQTGLMWKRCSEGQSWDGSNCSTGPAGDYTWQEALQRAQAVNAGEEGDNLGHDDWRLPNKNELASLVERQCHNPAINLSAFPGTPADSFWSASSSADKLTYAWYTFFDDGHVDKKLKTEEYYVRLVRGGQ